MAVMERDSCSLLDITGNVILKFFRMIPVEANVLHFLYSLTVLDKMLPMREKHWNYI
jgi:hypothetical protein